MIAKKVEAAIAKILAEGHLVNNTIEINNMSINIAFKLYNRFAELKSIRLYYDSKGLDFRKIEDSEKYFYNRINECLRHTIKKVLNEMHESKSSRKLVFSSDECISVLHLMQRNDIMIVNVYIRSSDVLKILPIDIVYLIDIVYEVSREFKFNVTGYSFDITIGSAHIYNEDVSTYLKSDVVKTKQLAEGYADNDFDEDEETEEKGDQRD